jgi:hypothetical protein
MPFDHREDGFRLRVQRAGKPPRGELDAAPFHRLDLRIKGRNVLRAIIVGEPPDPEAREHLGALFRAALFGIKRHDAPRDQVFSTEHITCQRRGDERRAEARQRNGA